MPEIISRIRSLIYIILYQCARVVFSITKIPIRGSLVAVWNDGKILLIKKSYQKDWSVPGGLLKKGETWEQAAVRETFEEVGVPLNEKHLMFIAEVPGDLGPNDRPHLFEVILDAPIDINIDGREILDAEFVDPKEAFTRNLSKQISTYLQTHGDGLA